MDLERSDVERLVRVEKGVESLEKWAKDADTKLDAQGVKLDALMLSAAAGNGFLNGIARVAPWIAIIVSVAVAIRAS